MATGFPIHSCGYSVALVVESTEWCEGLAVSEPLSQLPVET
jgi:hypothetical protein